MVKDAYTYPTRLTQPVAHLPLEDSLEVYAAASQQEKKEIRRAVAAKIASYYSLVEKGKKAAAEYRSSQPRIQKFFQDKP
jgi:hypothetical protein